MKQSRGHGQKTRHNLTLRIEIRRDTATASDDAATSYGERVKQMVKYYEGWAAHYGSASKVVFLANRNAEICSDIYVVRYGDLTKGITAAMAVVIGNRTLRIAAVEHEDDRKLWMRLLCVEEK